MVLWNSTWRQTFWRFNMWHAKNEYAISEIMAIVDHTSLNCWHCHSIIIIHGKEWVGSLSMFSWLIFPKQVRKCIIHYSLLGIQTPVLAFGNVILIVHCLALFSYISANKQYRNNKVYIHMSVFLFIENISMNMTMNTTCTNLIWWDLII